MYFCRTILTYVLFFLLSLQNCYVSSIDSNQRRTGRYGQHTQFQKMAAAQAGRVPGSGPAPGVADDGSGKNGNNGANTPMPSHSDSDMDNDKTSSSGTGSDVNSKLLVSVAPQAPSASQKVTVVGTGAVGMACAFSLLTQSVTSEIALIDLNENKVKGEQMDLNHGSAFMKSAKITAGSDYKISANSKLIVVCAGVRQREGDTRLKLLERNLEILKTMIPPLVKYSPNAILLLVSNPVDILTYMAWKLSGLPRNRVIGSGTNLDSSRFNFLLSQKLNVAVESCRGWIIGEHGDSSVPVWSAVDVGGVRLRDLNPVLGTGTDPNNWADIHKSVVNSAYDIIKLKGYTSWAIGLSVANLVSTIFRNSNKIHAVSTNVKGMYNINSDVYLSLPCVLGEDGISAVVKLILTDDEIKKLQASAKIMEEHISKLNI